MPRDAAVHARTFRAFGVVVTARATDPALLAAIDGLLPPGHTDAPPAEAVAELSLAAAADLDAFDAELRRIVATNAPGHVFVHAGVVARDGRAIVLPAAT